MLTLMLNLQFFLQEKLDYKTRQIQEHLMIKRSFFQIIPFFYVPAILIEN